MSEDLCDGDTLEFDYPLLFLVTGSGNFKGCEAEGKPEVRAFAVFTDSDLSERYIKFHQLDSLICNADEKHFARIVKQAERQGFTHVAFDPREKGKMKWLMTIKTVLQRIAENSS